MYKRTSHLPVLFTCVPPYRTVRTYCSASPMSQRELEFVTVLRTTASSSM